MKKTSRWKSGGVAAALTFSLFMGIAMGTAEGSTHGNPTQELAGAERSVITQPASNQSGILGWLESLLPNGMRFIGPAVGSKNQSEVLATADCFNSGAGISCSGFTNLEAYLAAVHASQNLGIPFSMLKNKLQKGMTLHQAIHELRPTSNAQFEARRAEQQAEQSLRDRS
jgi:hypothetical protein